MGSFHRSSHFVLGQEIELDFSANGNAANVLIEGQTVGNVSQQAKGHWVSSLHPDRDDSLQNHLEAMVKAHKPASARKYTPAVLRNPRPRGGRHV